MVTVILFLGFPRSGLAAALAISVMMLPIIARASEVVLRVVPNGLREASLALGCVAVADRVAGRAADRPPRARPPPSSSAPRAGSGETSPVLLTAGYTTYLNLNPTQGPMVSLPLLTFFAVAQPGAGRHRRGRSVPRRSCSFLVLVLFAVARAVVARQ